MSEFCFSFINRLELLRLYEFVFASLMVVRTGVAVYFIFLVDSFVKFVMSFGLSFVVSCCSFIKLKC